MKRLECYNCKTTTAVALTTIGNVDLPPMCPTCKEKFIRYWSCKNCGAIRTKPQGQGWQQSRWTACVPCYQKKHGIVQRKRKLGFVEQATGLNE